MLRHHLCSCTKAGLLPTLLLACLEGMHVAPLPQLVFACCVLEQPRSLGSLPVQVTARRKLVEGKLKLMDRSAERMLQGLQGAREKGGVGGGWGGAGLHATRSQPAHASVCVGREHTNARSKCRADST